MKAFVCKVCGFASINGSAPDKCPVCGAPKTSFEEKEGAIKTPQDANNLSDLEKKHVPVIGIKKQCGLVGPGCVDANIKVGAALHVMEAKHYIMYIDLYLDRDFIARYHLTPEKLNPVLGVHLKVSSGKLSVLENCNLHGRWITETEI